ncbi:MAG: site-specific DNA-methyltransferase [Chloroflexaceae bacterium]|nr:site-specific DNA-methyltransferase [Chloroflexaceae bacterium]
MNNQLETLQQHRQALFQAYQDRISINHYLDRRLVSYQANKSRSGYNWFKYREGFSSQLVNYLLKEIHPVPGRLLDPFAGSGSALFAAALQGWETCGIEILPVGAYIIRARVAAEQVSPHKFAGVVQNLLSLDFTDYYDEAYAFQHIPITHGAYIPEAERELIGYLSYCMTNIADEQIQQLLEFAAFCILEEISYTRKDGQFLRWDARSGRSLGKKPFFKEKIWSFREAITMKLSQIASDLMSYRIFGSNWDIGSKYPTVYVGSSLDILPTLDKESFDVILTSPPYCNRYDYTRTYALELVYLGYRHEDVTHLRQSMLSCTVENKDKQQHMRRLYQGLARIADFDQITAVYEAQCGLHEVLEILEQQRESNLLNNPNVVRMIRNYFYEMSFIVFEMSQLLAPNGHIIMINDNVRYGGEEIPVDLILSNMAAAYGLEVEHIWSLPKGKGNSSQQMGLYGRTELRKGVYVWKKNK